MIFMDSLSVPDYIPKTWVVGTVRYFEDAGHVFGNSGNHLIISL